MKSPASLIMLTAMQSYLHALPLFFPCKAYFAYLWLHSVSMFTNFISSPPSSFSLLLFNALQNFSSASPSYPILVVALSFVILQWSANVHFFFLFLCVSPIIAMLELGYVPNFCLSFIGSSSSSEFHSFRQTYDVSFLLFTKFVPRCIAPNL